MLGGPRLGAVGWKEMYWDKGLLYEDGHLRNQAHHFSYFFVEVLKAKNDPLELSKVWYGARAIDLFNLQDRDLGRLAAYLAVQVNTGGISWKDLPSVVYQNIKK